MQQKEKKDFFASSLFFKHCSSATPVMSIIFCRLFKTHLVFVVTVPGAMFSTKPLLEVLVFIFYFIDSPTLHRSSTQRTGVNLLHLCVWEGSGTQTVITTTAQEPELFSSLGRSDVFRRSLLHLPAARCLHSCCSKSICSYLNHGSNNYSLFKVKRPLSRRGPLRHPAAPRGFSFAVEPLGR